MRYGTPYMGSKSIIAEWIIGSLPPNENFVDLFAGGCAVTHCAMLSGKWRNFIANDIGNAPQLFLDAVNGKYRDERRWIGREDFFRLKDTDPYVAICWSFGNNPEKKYLYGRHIEPYKRACHYAVVFDDWKEMRELCPEVAEDAYSALEGISDIRQRRKAFGPAIVKRLKEIGDRETVQNNPLYKSCHWRGGKLQKDGTVSGQTNKGGQDLQLESLQSIGLQNLISAEAIQGLERPQATQRLHVSRLSYEQVEIPPPRTPQSTATRLIKAQNSTETEDSTTNSSASG